MEKHLTLNDPTFEKLFETCQLSSEMFTHEAHLRLVWIHIMRYGYEKTLITIPIQLKHFVTSLGVKEKYHTTLTIAGIKMIYHFMLKSNANEFSKFLNEFPQLKHHFKALIQNHYSMDVFNDEIARSTFLIPDLLPFN